MVAQGGERIAMLDIRNVSEKDGEGYYESHVSPRPRSRARTASMLMDVQ